MYCQPQNFIYPRKAQAGYIEYRLVPFSESEYSVKLINSESEKNVHKIKAAPATIFKSVRQFDQYAHSNLSHQSTRFFHQRSYLYRHYRYSSSYGIFVC